MTVRQWASTVVGFVVIAIASAFLSPPQLRDIPVIVVCVLAGIIAVIIKESNR
jgi:cell division protein FtsW (lipid II flippase)